MKQYKQLCSKIRVKKDEAKVFKAKVRALKLLDKFQKRTNKWFCENVCWLDKETETCYTEHDVRVCNKTCPFWRK